MNSGHLWRYTPNPYWVNFPAALGHFLLANGPGFAPLSQHLLFLSSKCIYKSSGPSWAITRRSLTPALIAKPWLGCYFSPHFFFKGKCLRRCFFSPLYRIRSSKWYSCPSHLSHLMGVTQLSFSSETVPVTSIITLHIRKWCDVKVKFWQQASLGCRKVYKWPSPIGCFRFLLSFAGHAKQRYSERPFWGTGFFFKLSYVDQGASSLMTFQLDNGNTGLLIEQKGSVSSRQRLHS